ncbi:hypothetical protein [Ectopseudomonas oleovorans]|uniref:RiboL-PSP-HEPN domain-containing protein n=1 Tax=Ectopseudomonas oleovorans TaxID=301 RepID=A0AB35L630_ECTOL|nr:hypothetical protein [Pseudomonas oleovorans]MCR1828992.1 hypothetical protein [Pseudomonas oleovorans]MDH0568856.1 hypothetical protein [Pseudomonas oleovorans]MDH2200922.1 hypothetical protein [Pseudomonas oleovorans]
MERWKVDLKSPELARIYDEYLHSQERSLIFYLSSVVLSKHANFPEEHQGTSIRASSDFDDDATSIRTIGQIHALIEDGRYDQLSRSFIVVSMVAALGDCFDGVRRLLQLDQQDIKKTVTVKERNRPDAIIKPAALKIAHLVNNTLNLNARICDHYSSRWINCIINLRHMFVHDKGLFNRDYKAHMINAWDSLEAGESITFNENQVDAILWFFNDHVRDFVSRLDEKLPPSPT